MQAGFRIKKRFLVWWKWSLSFRKLDWELEDYPIAVREQHFDLNRSAANIPRPKLPRFVATIINWYGTDGTGDTRDEALNELRKNFRAQQASRAKEGKSLPRPGATVPIEFASQDRVNVHRELKEDFVRRVLGLRWAFISDESSLWDFHSEETNEALLSKIKAAYGVSVDDIESGRLCEIFERIAEARRSH
jgi:hypothetical protein